jgi:mercuric ion transport protein
MNVSVEQQASRATWLSYLSLFSSLGTLLCCALPTLLVFFGLGATVAGVLSAAPWLVGLSRHKAWVFALAGSLIGLNFVYVYALAPRLKTSIEVCSQDDAACGQASRLSRIVLWLSAGVYTIGFVVAFILGPLLLWWDSRK